jgi:hypothetical protein
MVQPGHWRQRRRGGLGYRMAEDAGWPPDADEAADRRMAEEAGWPLG